MPLEAHGPGGSASNPPEEIPATGSETESEHRPSGDLRLLEDFDAHLSLERRLSPNTAAAYRNDLSALATFLERGGSGLTGATYPQLRRWLAHLSTLGYART